jgi:uncharacterized protein
MPVKDRIQEDTKAAMRSRDQRLLGVLRLLLAAIKQREVDERITLDDPEILNVITKMLKQRRDSIAQFEQGGRQDLVDQEAYEITVLEAYLPEQLSEAEIDQLVQRAIDETHANSLKDMGKVMATVQPHIQGRADTALVSQKIKKVLGPVKQ